MTLTGRAPRDTLGRAAASAARLLRVLEHDFGVTRTGAAVLGISLGGWLLARLIGGRAMFLMVYGALTVMLISFLVGRRRPTVRVSRSNLPPRVRQGQTVEVGLELEARRRMSGVILEEALHPELGNPVRVPIATLPGGRTVRHVYRFAPRTRGVYEVGPLSATWSDAFGLTRRQMVLAEAVEVVVHPSTEEVQDRVLTRAWEDPPIRPPVSKPWPIGFEFYGMRDYAPGDDPRRIVWRATARTLDPLTGAGRYLVRQSEQGITDRVSLLLDTDAQWHSPGAPSATMETAVRAVASLAVRQLRDGFSVTLETNGRRVLDSVRSSRARIRLLDELARVQPERVPLAVALQRLAANPRSDLHSVIVTPHLDREAIGRLGVLLQRGASVLVALVMGEDSDSSSLTQAAALGCNVVELEAGAPLEGSFRRVVGAGARRER